MGIKKAYLTDEENKVIAIYEANDHNHDLGIEGKIEYVFSWSLDGKPKEKELFAKLSVRWDTCSHYHFLGEGYENGGAASYYHICGVHNYIDFMRMLVFAYEIMVEHVGKEKIEEPEDLQKIRKFGLLDDCKIDYVRD